jgi:colicin import membrane protein
VNFGLTLSLAVHAGLILWALVTIRATPPLKIPEQTPVEVAIITGDDLVRLTKGDRNAKRLETDGSEGTAKADPKKQAKTPPPPPAAAPPPPPPPPAPEPPKVEPPKPDQVAALIEKEPPKPAVPAGPTPDEQKKLEAALKADQDKAEAEIALKKAQEEEAKKRAEEEAKKKAEEEARRKKAAEDAARRRAEAARKKAAEEAARKKAEDEAKKKTFNLDDIAKKIEDAPDNPESGPKQALKDNRKPAPQPAAGAKSAQGPKGPRAGAPEGTDTQLTAGQQNMLVGLMRTQISRCWNINAGLQDAARLIPVFDFELNPDGSLRGEPQLVNPDSSPQFVDAANSALRALKCASPFRDLPPDLYAHWQYSRFRFDPSQMFR